MVVIMEIIVMIVILGVIPEAITSTTSVHPSLAKSLSTTNPYGIHCIVPYHIIVVEAHMSPSTFVPPSSGWRRPDRTIHIIPPSMGTPSLSRNNLRPTPLKSHARVCATSNRPHTNKKHTHTITQTQWEEPASKPCILLYDVAETKSRGLTFFVQTPPLVRAQE